MQIVQRFIEREGVDVERMLVPVRVLWASLTQHDLHGLPLVDEHDNHTLLGWAYFRALVIGPSGAELWGESHFPETEDETHDVVVRAREFRRRTLVDRTSEGQPRLHKAVGNRIQGRAEWMWDGTTCLVNAGLATRVAPMVFEKADSKSGLVPLRALKPVGPGVFEVAGGIVLFAHRLFRREGSRHNTLNVELLDSLQQLARSDKIHNLAVRLDPDMVGLAGDIARSVERVYWRGPRFNNDLTSIPLGVTVHGPPPDEDGYLVSKTEFWWQSRDGQRIFECEEVRDRPASWSDERWPCRYAHSILDESSGVIEHLDGAVRLWDDEGMVTRCDISLPKVGRDSDYYKLWRLDGEINLGAWKELIYLHFRGNPALGEYFGVQSVRPLRPALEEAIAARDEHFLMLLARHPGVEQDSGCGGVYVRWDKHGTASSLSRSVAARLAEAAESRNAALGIPIFVAQDTEGLVRIGSMAVHILRGLDPVNREAITIGYRPLDSDIEIRFGLVGDAEVIARWLTRKDWFPPVADAGRLDLWFDAARAACWQSATREIAVTPSWTLKT